MSFTNLITNLIPPCIIAILVVTIIISRDKYGYYTINSSDMRSLVKITSIVFLALIILTTCLSHCICADLTGHLSNIKIFIILSTFANNVILL